MIFRLFARTLGLRRPGVSSMVGVLLILAFTSHVSYLTFVSFDYGYNMTANATIGISQHVTLDLDFSGLTLDLYFSCSRVWVLFVLTVSVIICSFTFLYCTSFQAW